MAQHQVLRASRCANRVNLDKAKLRDGRFEAGWRKKSARNGVLFQGIDVHGLSYFTQISLN
jgi:hypothetical protein